MLRKQPDEFVLNRHTAAFWTILAIAIGLRTLLYVGEPGLDLTADEHQYVRGGRAAVRIVADLLHGDAVSERDVERFYGRGWHPPLGKLVAGIPVAFGGIALARFIQLLISCALVVVAYRLFSRLFPTPAALSGMALVGLSPSLIGFSNQMWTENLYLLLSTLFLLWIVDLGYERSSHSRGKTVGVGVLVGLLLLLKTAFLPVLLACGAAAVILARNRRTVVRSLGVVATIGLLLAMTWDLMLWQREGRYVHGSTATQIHLLARYNQRDLGRWVRAWTWAQQEAARRGDDYTSVARAAWLEDLAETPPTEVLARIADDTVTEYLFPFYFLEIPLSHGAHWLSEFPRASTWLLVLEYDFRTMLIALGGAGLLFGALERDRRLLFLAFLIGNMTIVFVGLPTSRHNLMIVLPLSIGVISLATLVQRRRRGNVELAFGLLACAMIGTGLFSRLPPMPWPARFVEPLSQWGRGVEFTRDAIEVRLSGACSSKTRFDLVSEEATHYLVKGRRFHPEQGRAIDVSRRNGAQIQIIRSATDPRRTISVTTPAGASRLDLGDAPRRWTRLDQAGCFVYRWRGR